MWQETLALISLWTRSALNTQRPHPFKALIQKLCHNCGCRKYEFSGTEKAIIQSLKLLSAWKSLRLTLAFKAKTQVPINRQTRNISFACLVW